MSAVVQVHMALFSMGPAAMTPSGMALVQGRVTSLLKPVMVV